MADTTTELEVLDEIVDVLGGQSGQYETVVPTLQQIRDLLGGGGGGGGYNPALSVGRADALTGADSTAQWATRESEGSGAATVRSVQGAVQKLTQMVGTPYVSQAGTRDGVTYTITDEHEIAASGTPTVRTAFFFNEGLSFKSGHVYLFCGMYGVTQQAMIRIRAVAQSTFVASISANEQIFTSQVTADDGRIYFDVYTSSAAPFGGSPQVFDLTDMYGAGNEPSTVEAFRADYPFAYYPRIMGELVPVRIAGITSTDAQGGELDAIEWPTQTLRAAGSVADVLYSDHVDVKVGVVDLGTLNWTRPEVTAGSGVYAFESYAFDVPFAAGVTNFKTALYPCVGNSRNPLIYTDKAMTPWNNGTTQYIGIRDDAYTTPADFKAAMNGVLLYYELATPTTTPISPALPMTYRVQQGGSESIIVPEGEVSAAPVLTVAEGESATDVVMDALACIATPDGPVATANHAVGTYLTMQGKLYKVTRAIAVGESIVAGTNVTETTVMAEVLSLIQ